MNTIIDLTGFRFRKSPLLDYSLFDPVNEEEWKRLERALRRDEAFEYIRQEVIKDPVTHMTVEVARTETSTSSTHRMVTQDFGNISRIG